MSSISIMLLTVFLNLFSQAIYFYQWSLITAKMWDFTFLKKFFLAIFQNILQNEPKVQFSANCNGEEENSLNIKLKNIASSEKDANSTSKAITNTTIQ